LDAVEECIGVAVCKCWVSIVGIGALVFEYSMRDFFEAQTEAKVERAVASRVVVVT
jgi:hypothetical protein